MNPVHSNGPFVRRELFQRLFGLASLRATTMLAQQRSGKNQAATTASGPMREIRSYRNAFLLCVSPNSATIALYFTEHALTSFEITTRGVAPTRTDKREIDGHLEVVRLGDWVSIASAGLHTKPVTASFFIDGSVYVETELAPPNFRDGQRLVVDASTKQLDRETITRNPGEGYSILYALDDRTLLGADYLPGSSQIQGLRVINWSDKKILMRAPLSLDPKGTASNTSVTVSAERNRFVCAAGRWIDCHRVSDLLELWKREIEAGPFGVWATSITPSGHRVAVAVIDKIYSSDQKRCFVEVLDGHNGSTVARLPVNGFEGIGISHDGRFLAVGQRVAKDMDVSLVIEIYDVLSGRLVATGLHDRVPPSRYQKLLASFDHHKGIQFMPDGQHLITSSSSNVVKIWECKGLG